MPYTSMMYTKWAHVLATVLLESLFFSLHSGLILSSRFVLVGWLKTANFLFHSLHTGIGVAKI